MPLNTDDRIVISGFGNPGVNGSYYYVKEFNSNPYYEHTSGNYLLLYTEKFSNHSESEAYYIVKRTNIGGAIPKFTPLYRADGVTNVFSTTASSWISLEGSTSRSNYNLQDSSVDTLTSGTSIIEYESSSSSDSSNSSSSSSSSN